MSARIATESDSQQPDFSEEVGLTAARWVIRINSGDCPGQRRPELESWLAADPSHRKAFRAMTIAACFRKAARPDATAQDMRELEVAILGHPLQPPAGSRSLATQEDDV
jgi:ferric-dicitrate binding protein FerR (iron transport regulator)